MTRTYPRRSSSLIQYHGREGYPVIHQDKKTRRLYIMVRRKGGGTKRLYEGSTYRDNGRTKTLRLS